MKNATVADNSAATSTPQAGAGFRRVLSLRDLALFGFAFVGPTAPYSMYGIATVKSHLSVPKIPS